MVMMPQAVRDAMVAEAGAEVRALHRDRLAVIVVHVLIGTLSSAIGTSVALWFWLFRD